jgi:hypothetical protein
MTNTRAFPLSGKPTFHWFTLVIKQHCLSIFISASTARSQLDWFRNLIIFYFIYGFQNPISFGHLKMPKQGNINNISILQTALQLISVSQIDLSRSSQFTSHVCNRPEDILTYLLTPRNRVLLENLIDFHLHFMEPEDTMLHSQAHATCPYPKPDRSSPCPHIPLPEDSY